MFGYNSFNAIKLYLISDFLKETQDQVRCHTIKTYHFFPRLAARFTPNSPPRLIWGWRCEVPSLMDVIRDR